MKLTRQMVREEDYDAEDGVVVLLAEDKDGNLVPTGRYMRWLAGTILDKPLIPKGRFRFAKLKK